MDLINPFLRWQIQTCERLFVTPERDSWSFMRYNIFMIDHQPITSFSRFVRLCIIQMELSDVEILAVIIYFVKMIMDEKCYFLLKYPHKLFGVCALLAQKVHSDFAISNASYAQAINASVCEINDQEIKLLFGINFELYTTKCEIAMISKMFNFAPIVIEPQVVTFMICSRICRICLTLKTECEAEKSDSH